MAAILTIQKLNILIKNCYTIQLEMSDDETLIELTVSYMRNLELAQKTTGNTINECLDKLDWDELI